MIHFTEMIPPIIPPLSLLVPIDTPQALFNLEEITHPLPNGTCTRTRRANFLLGNIESYHDSAVNPLQALHE